MLSAAELTRYGISAEEGAKLQKAWKERKPPSEKTPAEKSATGGGTRPPDTIGPSAAPYDDAILRQNRQSKPYSSGTVNNEKTAKIAQGPDKTVETINDPTADLSSNWTPPSQRGIQ